MLSHDDVESFLGKIDAHLRNKQGAALGGRKFHLRIIGKSALLLAGLKDSTATADIDSLGVDGEKSESEIEIEKSLVEEFSRKRLAVYGSYLEFVPPAIVFLPQKPRWNPFAHGYDSLRVEYLDASYVVASKMFSTFSSPGRKRDRQDITDALDQKVADFPETVRIAEKIFDVFCMDARSHCFAKVHEYITTELMPRYGTVTLNYEPTE